MNSATWEWTVALVTCKNNRFVTLYLSGNTTILLCAFTVSFTLAYSLENKFGNM